MFQYSTGENMIKKTLLIVLAALGLLPLLQASSPAAVARRQAFTRECGEDAAKAAKYLKDKDPEIRRYAIYLYAKAKGVQAKEVLKAAAVDKDMMVRTTAVSALCTLAKKDASLNSFLTKIAADDPELSIRELAGKASWPFKREIKLLRNDPGWDHEILSVKRWKLDDNKWRFITDPGAKGHTEKNKYYAKKVSNPGKWKPIKYGYWENQGFGDYDGIGWYRIRFTMPKKVAHNAVEIQFSGVDESAWVWLNGIYLGCHDIGVAGHNKYFAVDATKEVKFGAENVLTVRVKDTGAAGGIWRPVHVEILK